MEDLSRRLYAAAQVRELDRRAIQDCGVPGYELMCRAAAAAWRAACERHIPLRSVAVLAGSGNNGGDGYVIARLAHAAGCRVEVCEVGGPPTTADAARARADWQACGPVAAWPQVPAGFLEVDLVVDAIFGTGLSRPPEGAARAAIEAINGVGEAGHGAVVLAVDIPSGLLADTGVAPGAAVRADITATFIGRKFGLHTGAGPDYAGEVVFDALEVPFKVYEELPCKASLLQSDDLCAWLPPRRRSAHKGDCGHVLIAAGDLGMCGAALIAARAAGRTGAGLVSVATRAEHAGALAAAQPEAMFRGVESAAELRALLDRADVVALGPGLGQGIWGRMVYAEVLACGKPLVVDADALNLLAQAPQRREDWVLTPHPGEAARLLHTDAAGIGRDRAAAAAALQQSYGGAIVLKGAGSLVQGAGLAVCPYGNPGMAAGGMGDALTGVVAALRAQGLGAEDSARAGVLVHALAGDRAAAHGERGLLPSDLIAELRAVVNPHVAG